MSDPGPPATTAGVRELGAEPMVLARAEVADRVAVLTTQLRPMREDLGLSVRHVADLVGVSTATLWRLESGRGDPHWSTFALLAGGYRHMIDLVAPGRERPWVTVAGQITLPAGYWPCSRAVPMVRHARTRWATHDQMIRIGAELWWARQHELDPPLDATAAAKLLGISRSTLRNVEHGAFQPRLSTVVLAAGLTGRHLVLSPRCHPRMTP